MPYKVYEIPEIGSVKVYKRRGAKSVKLSITNDNQVRVSLPFWAPYIVGFDFAVTKTQWIKNKQSSKTLLIPGSHIGKAHRLVFHQERDREKIVTRVVAGEVRVLLPMGIDWQSNLAQNAASAACKRALKNQAEALLPKRIETLAATHGYTFKAVTVKHMKSRWGSCNHKQEIILNTYLMQLPWELIDYVIIHELVHTQIMAHGQLFWKEVELHVQNLKTIRKTMRGQKPVVLGQAY